MNGLSLAGTLRSTAGTVLLLLLCTAAAAGMLTAVTARVPGGDRDLRAYAAAEPCPEKPAAPAECRWTEEYTVSGIERPFMKRGESNRALLTSADGDTWETSYPSDGPVFTRLDEGDRVEGTVWRGRLTEIAAGGDSQATHDAPYDEGARMLIGALIVLPPSLLGAAVCVWRLRRRAEPEPTRGMRATLGLAVGLFFAGLFAPLALMLGDWGENAAIVAAAWLPMAAIGIYSARLYTTHEPTPAPPGW
ncbi:hypothetical protein [Nocardiopsis trehalosi]|uniref:hypothetical protein n=1 Tax=Nocardiopsis trehalosi TaxID=109329 RepID=UPI00082AF160|nr:hypothetical protein [Nocardiopsis trehalosi]